MKNNRSTTTAATILSVAAVVAVCSAWVLMNQSPARTLPTPSPAPSPSTRSPHQGDASPSASRQGYTAPPSSLVPKRLTIPAIGVAAPIDPSGVAENGDAEIPADGDVVGWYRYSDAPGSSTGSTVLIGHRDTDAQGAGALFDLDLVSAGDSIVVDAGRRALEYRVTAVRRVAKASLPASLFRRGGPPQLVVITCGGAYLPESGGYQENLYVKAVPAGD